MNLVLHATSARDAERFIRNPAHALIVVGPSGSGKKTFISYIAGQLLGGLEPAELGQYPYLHIVQPPKDKTAIGIDEIRELHRYAKLAVPGSESRKRLLVIHDAHTMTTEAQNALLKLLEEPPRNTFIMLAAAEEQALLPTIRSRAQRLQLHRPNRSQLQDFFVAAGYTPEAIKQTAMLSGGLPGLQQALLENAEHPLAQAVQRAREILQADSFSRLAVVDELSKKKPECLQVLFVLQQMAQAAIEQAALATAPADAIKKRLVQWQRILRAAYQAEQALRANAQAKLVLDDLFLAF